MEDIKEDKVANAVLDGLPPSFMVFGKPKEINPLEEFWMNKLTNIEKQYDQHIVELERKLLSERATKRSIKKQTGKIVKLEESLTEKGGKLEQVTSKSRLLTGKLREKEYEAKSLQQKLERASTIQKNISKRMEEERKVRIQFEKECTDLKNRLKRMEKERSQLLIDVDIKESERVRVEEREALMHREKWSFMKNLTDVDTERRIQTNANLKLCEDIEKLLGIEKSLEMNLLKERRVMGEMMEEMRNQKQEHKIALRMLDLAVKDKRNVDEVLQETLGKVQESERDGQNWKEELRFKEGEDSAKALEIRDLKRRNSKIRCMLADTKHKLDHCLSDMKSLEIERRRANVDLESAKRHEKSLQLEIKRNDLRKYKLAEKILKAHPYLMDNKRERDARIGRKASDTGPEGVHNEIESYKKQIWKLERNKDDVDRKLRELKRKENIYRLKLDKYGEMEKQIFWTGKAMAKLEGDRQRLEMMLNTMESNMPMKVPFRKLVTDPSVLDRLAKNKVLQKRLLRQTEKMEELKSNARRILQFREEEFGRMGPHPEEIPVWKLSFWNKQSLPETLLSGLHIDIGAQRRGSLSLKSLTDDSNYKNYLHFLDEEIPKLKVEIEHLEKKKLCMEVEKESEESRKKKEIDIALERKRLMASLLEDELPVQVPDASALGEEIDGEDESNNLEGQCTPASIHGSSFDEQKKVDTEARQVGESEKAKIKKQIEHVEESDDDEESVAPADDEGSRSSEAASDIPTD